MNGVAIVTLVALIQYVIQGIRVGQARGRYGVEAPAVSGHPLFERHFRVHQNTMEQLVAFVPGMWLFAHYVGETLAVLLGLVFVAGRFMYERGYLADPKQRGTGAALSGISNVALLAGGLLGALWSVM